MTCFLDRSELRVDAPRVIRHRLFLLFVSLMAAGPALIHADDCISMRGARIYASDFGQQGFKLRLNEGERASGRLFRFDLKGKEKTVWTAKLVTIPTDVYVADHDPMVVAISSGPCSGAFEHAVVVYGANGTVLADYRLDDLLTAQERDVHVKRSITSWTWAEDARVQFDHQAKQVVIMLAWGRQIRLDAATGRVASARG